MTGMLYSVSKKLAVRQFTPCGFNVNIAPDAKMLKCVCKRYEIMWKCFSRGMFVGKRERNIDRERECRHSSVESSAPTIRTPRF